MTSKLQSLTELWQEFDLTGTQKLLDELATGITTRQDESDTSRKLLIELIRNFKKSNSEETRLIVAPLLKSFQNEIDNLSKRSKSAEKSFFDIYKKFFDIADPVPTLEYCMENIKNLQKLQDLEIETAQLRETLTDCSKEITEYKEKLKNLKDIESKYKTQEEKMFELIDQKVAKKEEDLQKMFDEKNRVLDEERQRNSQKLSDSVQKMTQMQRTLTDTQTELYEIKTCQDQQRNARSEEVDLVIVDLERANQRALTAEREVLTLQEQLKDLQSSQSSVPVVEDFSDDQSAALRNQLMAKEQEVIQLVEDFQKANKSNQETESRCDKKISELELENDRIANQLEMTKTKLEGQSDYESVKKDLSILKSLYFPSQNTEEEDPRALEVLILERSKTLQNDNSMLRQDKERLLTELTEAREELTENKRTLARQSELISQLEEHVDQLQTITTPYREEAEGRSSSDMLAEALKVDTELEDMREASPILSMKSALSSSTESSLLPIVEAQRERLRLRNDELESLSLTQQHQLTTLTSQVESLQQDNVKLYEKIRFLQSCGATNRRKEDTVVAVESRYQSEYERKLDPFQSFSQAERKRKYGQLSVAEKVILSLVRFIVSNKTARMMLTLYSILLHGLVFVVLYKMAMNESCKHDMAAKWHEKFIEHMQDVHGNVDNIG